MNDIFDQFDFGRFIHEHVLKMQHFLKMYHGGKKANRQFTAGGNMTFVQDN